MLKAVVKSMALVGCFALLHPNAQAQERVHALSGKVTSIYPKIGMIDVATDDGSSGHFRWVKPGTAIDFDKAVSEDAISPDKFSSTGDRVIVYYVGDGTIRTAVALHDLGTKPVTLTTGTVVKLSRHDRILTLKNSAGTELDLKLDPKTVADTPTGVVEGLKFDLSKGDPVRVTSQQKDGGGQVAVLIAPVM